MKIDTDFDNEFGFQFEMGVRLKEQLKQDKYKVFFERRRGDRMGNKKKLKEETPLSDNNQIEDDKIYDAIKDVDVNDLIDIPNGDLSILLKD